MQTVGLDLGTTNTTLAVDGEVRALGDGERPSPFLPSVVAYLPSEQIRVGTSARRRRAIDPKNTLYSTKRIIGRGWHSVEAQTFRELYPFDHVEVEGGAAGFQTRRVVRTPVEIATEIVRAACERAQLDPALHQIVVTVPSSFEQEPREATRMAVAAAGFTVAGVLDEPLATVLAYAAQEPRSAGRVAVYDLGGGTFDFAIVDVGSSPPTVIAHGGDPYLGGDDVDRALATWVAEQILARHGWDLRSDPAALDRLIHECERSKIRLGFSERTTLDLTTVDPAAPEAVWGVGVDRAQLEQLSARLVARTFSVCDEVLDQAGMKASDLSTVLLAGGSTSLPSVQHGVGLYFGQRPLCQLDPMEVVGLGASR